MLWFVELVVACAHYAENQRQHDVRHVYLFGTLHAIRLGHSTAKLSLIRLPLLQRGSAAKLAAEVVYSTTTARNHSILRPVTHKLCSLVMDQGGSIRLTIGGAKRSYLALAISLAF